LAEWGYIDEAIVPHGTRKRTARALQMLCNKHVENPWSCSKLSTICKPRDH
jgi:propionyl-CoA carboxylase beta subunit